MSQRILERGQIETLASRSIPRVRVPERSQVFAQRGARLLTLAQESPIADYLRFCAVLADAQHAALADFAAPPPTPARLALAHEHRMPPLAATNWPRAPQWREALAAICAAVVAQREFPAEVTRLAARVAATAGDELEAQADAVLGVRDGAIDVASAPFVMAALQVNWAALSSGFAAGDVQPLDVPGVCPLCGSLPVASLVRAQRQYQGYRYLHCALCACEWHMVRVQCSQCGADGKDIVHHSLTDAVADDAIGDAAVRAESCGRCRTYRKILYHEKDPALEPVADDLASLALDLLLAEEGYERASGNPLLWTAEQG
jgi:FdhE protein